MVKPDEGMSKVDELESGIAISLDKVHAIQGAAIDVAEKMGATLLDLAYASKTLLWATSAQLELKAMSAVVRDDTDDDDEQA